MHELNNPGAAARRDQMGEGVLDRQERAGEVDSDHGLPFVQSHRRRPAGAGDAGTAHQRVDAAECVRRSADGVGDIALVADIAMDGCDDGGWWFHVARCLSDGSWR